MAKGKIAEIQEAIVNLIDEAIEKLSGGRQRPEPVPVRVNPSPDRRRKS